MEQSPQITFSDSLPQRLFLHFGHVNLNLLFGGFNGLFTNCITGSGAPREILSRSPLKSISVGK